MTQTVKSVEQSLAAIQVLDLDPIKLKLMDAEEGQGWTREYADRMEVAYKRYLTLLVKFPQETVAPTKDVDKFWHGHILDTMKYAEDCEQVFGFFLHHFPYFGMRGEEDAANLRRAAERMRSLHDQEFGAPAAASAAWCVAAKPAASADVAWCVVARPAMADSAWCVAARPEKADSAWCVAAQPAGKSAAAWCVAATPGSASAWCVAGKPAAQAGTAWCVASGNRVD